MTGALAVWAFFLAVAWFTSEGVPVCEGFLILSVDDSMPPGCPEPIEGLLDVGPPLLGLIAFFGWIGFLVTTGLDNRQQRKDVVSEDDG